MQVTYKGISFVSQAYPYKSDKKVCSPLDLGNPYTLYEEDSSSNKFKVAEPFWETAAGLPGRGEGSLQPISRGKYFYHHRVI